MHKHRSKSVGRQDNAQEPNVESRSILPIPGPEDREVRMAIKCVRMSEEMIQFAAVTAEKGLKTYSTRKDVAAFVKRSFDEKYGPLWHCVVGRDFGR